MEGNKEVNITYETLFEILRREKDKEELQNLPKTFFGDVVSYLREKNQVLMQNSGSADDLFSQDTLKTQEQIENIKRILKELYARREKKIVNFAMDKSRIKSALINLSPMLPEEKMLFDSLVTNLDNGRDGILKNLLDQKLPSMKESEKTPEHEGPIEKPPKSTKLIRFTLTVPKFVGKELEEYGPFEEEDIASIPTEIADVLIAKGRAEELKENE